MEKKLHLVEMEMSKLTKENQNNARLSKCKYKGATELVVI